MSALLRALGGLPSEAPIYYEHRNTGITCIDLTRQGARVRYLNRAHHLPEELDTY